MVVKMEQRKDGESYLSFVKRVTEAFNNGILDAEQWSQLILGENLYSEETTRRCAKFFTSFLENLNQDEEKDIDSNCFQDLENIKQDIIKERKKLQTVNLEAQEYYRTLGRQELFNEKIVEAIQNLPQLQVKNIEVSYPIETTGLLLLADQHYDSNFELKGLFGEVINKYDKEEFKNRMWRLLGMMVNDRFEYDRLIIVSCGDALEGILRMSSLQKLKGNVIDDAIEFAEFMASWLCEAEKQLYVPIEFSIISGNHDVSRMLTTKPEFPEETLAKVIQKIIELRIALAKENENNRCIKVMPYNDVFYKTIYDSNIMVAHGDAGNLNDLIDYYENYYGVEIDTLYGAHLHHSESKSIGVGSMGDREVVRIPSICGTDIYAKKMLKHNRAGAYFALYSELGKELNKIYYLN